MRRRQFISLLGAAAAALPLYARAQQLVKQRTIGFLGSSTPLAMSQWVAAFVQRLRDLGWIEGRTVTIEYRWAEGRSSRAAEIAAEFVQLKVDVIVTYGTSPVLAAKQATSVIPIVFAAANDPVGAGRGAGGGSYARPRGHHDRDPARSRHRAWIRRSQGPSRGTLCLYRPACNNQSRPHPNLSHGRAPADDL